MTKQIVIISSISSIIIQGEGWVHHRWLAQKLNHPSATTKTYWSNLKRFYNGKRVPVIPLLLINNKLELDFKIKANFLNSFFASKYTPLI